MPSFCSLLLFELTRFCFCFCSFFQLYHQTSWKWVTQKSIVYRKLCNHVMYFKKSLICTYKASQIVGKQIKVKTQKNKTNWDLLTNQTRIRSKSILCTRFEPVEAWIQVQKKIEKKEMLHPVRSVSYLVQICVRDNIRTDLHLYLWQKMYV